MCSTAGSAIFLGQSKDGTGRHIRGCVIKRGSRKADKPKSKVEKQNKKWKSKEAEKLSEAGKQKSKEKGNDYLSVQTCASSAWATPKYARRTDAKINLTIQKRRGRCSLSGPGKPKWGTEKSGPISELIHFSGRPMAGDLCWQVTCNVCGGATIQDALAQGASRHEQLPQVPRIQWGYHRDVKLSIGSWIPSPIGIWCINNYWDLMEMCVLYLYITGINGIQVSSLIWNKRVHQKWWENPKIQWSIIIVPIKIVIQGFRNAGEKWRFTTAVNFLANNGS